MDRDTHDRLRALGRAERLVRRRAGANVEFQLDPHVHRTFGNSFVVHGQQQYRGLSLYPHSFQVHLHGRKSLLTGDSFIEVEDIDVRPRRSASAAVAAAYEHLRGGAGDACRWAHEPMFARGRYRPRPLAVFPMPNQPTVFASGPFYEAVTANIVLHVGEHQTALAWLVAMAVEDVGDFSIVVDAATTEVLWCAADAASAVCFGNVTLFDPDEAGPVFSRFPRPLSDYSAGIRPTTDFADWVETNATFGNNVETLFDNSTRRVVARPTAAGLQFQPAGAAEEQLVNAFFLCNFLHDFFSLVGFGEADGNFQETNTGSSGIDGDRLIVTVLPRAHGRANMRAQTDGKDAEMRLGAGAMGRHTALDAAVVVHEYAHGVSQRLVGGLKKKDAFKEPQSAAMGEGWSDYFAITLLNSYRDPARRQYAFAPWSSGNPAGARRERYDAFTATYGRLGTPPHDEVHEAGSIFAAALIRMHEELTSLLGTPAGDETGWRLVIASMKKLGANPNFLHGREELLHSVASLGLPAGTTTSIERIIRRAFAERGMGRSAVSADSSFTRIQEAFNT